MNARYWLVLSTLLLVPTGASETPVVESPWGLLASPGDAGTSLEWQAPVGPAPLGYVVYRAQGAENFTAIATTTAEAFLDAGATAQTLAAGEVGFRYYVTALFEEGESAESNEAWVMYPWCSILMVSTSSPFLEIHQTPLSCVWPLPDIPWFLAEILLNKVATVGD